MTLNALYPARSEVEVGIGRGFFSRAVLDAGGFDEAVAMAQGVGGCGFHCRP